jgi:hypothetical protein
MIRLWVPVEIRVCAELMITRQSGPRLARRYPSERFERVAASGLRAGEGVLGR